MKRIEQLEEAIEKRFKKIDNIQKQSAMAIESIKADIERLYGEIKEIKMKGEINSAEIKMLSKRLSENEIKDNNKAFFKEYYQVSSTIEN